MQRDEYLPLKVIKERLLDQETPDGQGVDDRAVRGRRAETPRRSSPSRRRAADVDRGDVRRHRASRSERIKELESFGLVCSHGPESARYYDGDDYIVLSIVKDFFRYGVEPRHLTMYKHFEEREAAFFETIVVPQLRQRNPDARRAAVELARPSSRRRPASSSRRCCGRTCDSTSPAESRRARACASIGAARRRARPALGRRCSSLSWRSPRDRPRDPRPDSAAAPDAGAGPAGEPRPRRSRRPARRRPRRREPPTIAAGSAVLADLDTGQVLFAQDADERRPIASVTKIMTALLVLERTEPGRTVVTVSAEADGRRIAGISALGLRAGERISVQELLYALLLQSANDAAVALAEHVSGTSRGSSTPMNARAAAARDCTTRGSRRPNGLDDRGYSTARDLAAPHARRRTTQPGVRRDRRRRGSTTIPAPDGPAADDPEPQRAAVAVSGRDRREDRVHDAPPASASWRRPTRGGAAAGRGGARRRRASRSPTPPRS